MAFQHILVPVDFTNASERALDFALDLAPRLGAAVTVVHAYQVPVYTLVPDGAFLPSAEMVASIQAAAQAELDALMARKRTAGVTVDAHLKNGSPSEAVLEAVKQFGADLVIMGSHGAGAFERALLGGVASKVVRLSPVPVITVRGTRAEPASAPPPPA